MSYVKPNCNIVYELLGSHCKFWYIFFVVQFRISSLETSSLTHRLFIGVLFIFQPLGIFCFLLRTCSLIQLWPENTLYITSVILNSLRFVLWPSKCSFLVNNPPILRNNVFFPCWVHYSKMSASTVGWWCCSFSSCIPLLIIYYCHQLPREEYWSLQL